MNRILPWTVLAQAIVGGRLTAAFSVGPSAASCRQNFLFSTETNDCDHTESIIENDDHQVEIQSNTEKIHGSAETAVSHSIMSEEGLPAEILSLPRHSDRRVCEILEKTENLLNRMHESSKKIEAATAIAAKEAGRKHETIYSNTYVDMGKIDTIGFDFDYTLVTYTEELLELIYSMALKRLVTDRQYPAEMLEAGLQYDAFFSIRGLAVDKETGWICHLSYSKYKQNLSQHFRCNLILCRSMDTAHKVAVAWEGK